MALKRVKSEDVVEYYGYWIYNDGTIVDREKGNVVPVYANGCVRLKKPSGTIGQPAAHTIIARCFVPNPEGYSYVRFKDGDPENRSAANLEWYRSPKPISGRTKEIIRLHESGSSNADIAYMMGVRPQYVHRVLKDYKQNHPRK